MATIPKLDCYDIRGIYRNPNTWQPDLARISTEQDKLILFSYPAYHLSSGADNADLAGFLQSKRLARGLSSKFEPQGPWLGAYNEVLNKMALELDKDRKFSSDSINMAFFYHVFITMGGSSPAIYRQIHNNLKRCCANMLLSTPTLIGEVMTVYKMINRGRDLDQQFVKIMGDMNFTTPPVFSNKGFLAVKEGFKTEEVSSKKVAELVKEFSNSKGAELMGGALNDDVIKSLEEFFRSKIPFLSSVKGNDLVKVDAIFGSKQLKSFGGYIQTPNDLNPFLIPEMCSHLAFYDVQQTYYWGNIYKFMVYCESMKMETDVYLTQISKAPFKKSKLITGGAEIYSLAYAISKNYASHPDVFKPWLAIPSNILPQTKPVDKTPYDYYCNDLTENFLDGTPGFKVTSLEFLWVLMKNGIFPKEYFECIAFHCMFGNDGDGRVKGECYRRLISKGFVPSSGFSSFVQLAKNNNTEDMDSLIRSFAVDVSLQTLNGEGDAQTEMVFHRGKGYEILKKNEGIKVPKLGLLIKTEENMVNF